MYMAKSEEKKESRIQTKKKSWYKIISPQIFGQREVGEAYLASQDAATGRTLQINLKELSGNVRDQSAYLTFKVVKAQPSGLQTAAIGYELTPGAVRRSVHKGAHRIDGYFTCRVKNGTLVVKTLLIPLSHVDRSVQNALRKCYQEAIVEEAGKLSVEEFLAFLASGRLRSLAKKKLDKIYPCREAVVRACFLRGNVNEALNETFREAPPAAAGAMPALAVPPAEPSGKAVQEEAPGSSEELVRHKPAAEVAAYTKRTQ